MDQDEIGDGIPTLSGVGADDIDDVLELLVADPTSRNTIMRIFDELPESTNNNNNNNIQRDVASFNNPNVSPNFAIYRELLPPINPQPVVQMALPERSPNSRNNLSISARIVILEQPAPASIRFRYEVEGRTAGSIAGIHSTNENKTFPSIQIVGYEGRVDIVVSLVTKDEPYKAHPHRLVGRIGNNDFKQGVYTVHLNNHNMIATLNNLGIQCVKKMDVAKSLQDRKAINVDPFRQGFEHGSQTNSIDLNAVRLCFQAFIKNRESRTITSLQPVVSDIIYDKKSVNELVICNMSDCTSGVTGGKKIILLCEKIVKEDIEIIFFEEKDGQTIWLDRGIFKSSDVHKQCAIAFTTPPYKNLDIAEPVKVSIQLRQRKQDKTSEALPFEYLPLNSAHGYNKRKRLNTLRSKEEVPDVPNHQQGYINQQAYQEDGAFGGALSLSIPTEFNFAFKTSPCSTITPGPSPTFSFSPSSGYEQIYFPPAPSAATVIPQTNNSSTNLSSLLNINMNEFPQLNSADLMSFNVDEENMSDSFKQLGL